MNINIIVAVDEAGGFGKNGAIPWNVAEDMAHFKETTKGHVCVMGRRTYTDMLAMKTTRAPKKSTQTTDMVNSKSGILPDRDSYVVTSNSDLETVGATKVSSLSEVLEKYKNTDRSVFVLGGYRMFVEALSHRPAVYMTIIPGNYQCSVKFPIQVLEDYKIVDGKELKECRMVEYRHK